MDETYQQRARIAKYQTVAALCAVASPFAVISVFVLVGVVSHDWQPAALYGGIAMVVAVVIYQLNAFVLSRLMCPKCKKPFIGGLKPTLGFRRTCFHCGFSLTEDP
jgi:hypothetical protein